MESDVQSAVVDGRSHFGGPLPAENVVQQLHSELSELLQRRAEIMRQIGTIKRTLVGLTALFGDNMLDNNLRELIGVSTGDRKPGLTKACRSILMDAERPMSARNVVDQLQSHSPAILAGHKDPIASVTTVLNRLADYNEAQRVLLSSGKRGWKWSAEESPAPMPAG